MWINKFSISKKEVLQYFKQLKSSKYCLPLVAAPVKIHFITLTNWGTKYKIYIIDELAYIHIELYKGRGK